MLTIRFADVSDAIDVLIWRNDAQTRKMSWGTELISCETHFVWFPTVIHKAEIKLFIGEFQSKKIGMVRFDNDAEVTNAWKVSIVVAPECRGHGLGKMLLANAVSRFLDTHFDALVIAEVRNTNFASQNLFEKAGFMKENLDGEKLIYKFPGHKYKI